VLGIDPGTAIVGFSLLEKSGSNINPVSFGHITTLKTESKENRLLEIYNNICEIIKKYSPQELAIEKLFFQRNITTAMSVSEARGVIILAAVQSNLKIFEYTPLQIKHALTGYGKADKKDVQQMVKAVLNLENTPKPDDVADAIAVALCHINFLKI
ncbi:MAG: crossover junction endodeoxyribonuclease RuvC, partial [Candidatus Muiribacteriota bacterium]